MNSSILEISKYAAIASLGVFFSPAYALNLVTNGDFEAQINDPFINGYVYLGSNSIPGWVSNSARGILFFNDIYRPVGEGGQAIQLESQGDSISQALTTESGQTYKLTFLLSAYDSLNGALTVSGPSFSYSATGTPEKYLSHSITFTATAETTSITFLNSGRAGFYNYPHIDSVSVSAVPEPSVALLLAFGLAAAIRYKRGNEYTQLRVDA